MKGNAVRMGGNSGRNRRTYFIAVAAAIACIALAVVISLNVNLKSTEHDAKPSGCRSDEQCGPGKICALGGCIILISSEHPGIWHDDLVAQTADGGVDWKPRPAFGEKLLEATNCPAVNGKVEPMNPNQVTPLVEATVYEVSAKALTIHKHRKVRGRVWQDNIRFQFTDLSEIDPKTVCASKEIVHVQTGAKKSKGAKKAYVDAALQRAVPAGSVAGAGISVRSVFLSPSPDGKRKFSFTLDPPLVDEMRRHSVVVLPLGTDVSSIKGVPPSRQRLFKDYFAYYWEHDSNTSRVTFECKLPFGKEIPIRTETLYP